jgi:hypothetical protein
MTRSIPRVFISEEIREPVFLFFPDKVFRALPANGAYEILIYVFSLMDIAADTAFILFAPGCRHFLI